ncbi:hypothetical protein HND97_02335 [Vibrio cholerae]|nr:hypothetical protein HND97_02335 [Vibrio cholerae]
MIFSQKNGGEEEHDQQDLLQRCDGLSVKLSAQKDDHFGMMTPSFAQKIPLRRKTFGI